MLRLLIGKVVTKVNSQGLTTRVVIWKLLIRDKFLNFLHHHRIHQKQKKIHAVIARINNTDKLRVTPSLIMKQTWANYRSLRYFQVCQKIDSLLKFFDTFSIKNVGAIKPSQPTYDKNWITTLHAPLENCIVSISFTLCKKLHIEEIFACIIYQKKHHCYDSHIGSITVSAYSDSLIDFLPMYCIYV